jgi:hypothetical protein
VEGVTGRAVALIAVGAIGLSLVTGCDSSSGAGSKGSSTTSTTVATKGPSAWVKQWDSTLVTDYGPAQEEFLAAVQTARVADIQQAMLKVQAADAALEKAIGAAGAPPESDAPAVAKLLAGLALERKLVPLIQSACTGKDPNCQDLVTKYADNNKDSIVPALTALRAAT